MKHIGIDHTMPPDHMGPFESLEEAEAFERSSHADRKLNLLAYSLPCADGTLTMSMRPDATTTEYPPPSGSDWGNHVLRPGEVSDTPYETRYMAWIAWPNVPLYPDAIGFVGCPFQGQLAPWRGGPVFDPDTNQGWCMSGITANPQTPTDYHLRIAMSHWRSQAGHSNSLQSWAEQHFPETNRHVVIDALPYHRFQAIPATDPLGQERQGAILSNLHYDCPPSEDVCTDLSWSLVWGPPPLENAGAKIAVRQTVWCPKDVSGFAYGEPRIRACRLHAGHGNLNPPACVNAGAASPPQNSPNVPTGFVTGTHIITDVRQTDSCPEGNPCYPGTGNKTLTETDFEFEGLRFQRHYNALRQLRAFASIDRNWVHSLSARLISPAITRGDVQPAAFACNADQVWMQTERNLLERFVRLPDGQFRSDNALGQVLTCEQDVAWTLRNRDGSQDVFDWAGKLIERRFPNRPNQGFTLQWVLGQDDLHRVVAVQFGSGRQLDFQYTVGPEDNYYHGKLASISSAGQWLVNYYYNSDGALAEVFLPDAVIRRYGYGEVGSVSTNADFRFHLTSISDNLTPYASYTYDDHGRVQSSTHSGGAGAIGVTYASGTEMPTVVLPDGATRVYAFREAAPQPGGGTQKDLFRRPLSRDLVYTNPQGQPVTFTEDSWTYHPNGRMATHTNARGHVTSYEYDQQQPDGNNDGRWLMARTDAVGTPQQRRHEYDYDVRFNRRTLHRILNAQSQVESEERWHYDDDGRVDLYCQIADPTTPGSCDPALPGGANDRRTIRLYCTSISNGCPFVGMLRTINGPRSDVNDSTSYIYYDADDSACAQGTACKYRRGDLKQVINALGQATTYLQYDSAGRPLVISDINSVQTHLSYNGRGLLLSRRVCEPGTPSYPCNSAGVATTTYSYTQWGALERITQPTGGWMEYQYDDARRVLRVIDSAGQRLDYCPNDPAHPQALCLDSAGHRRSELTYAGSALKRKMRQEYDQLGRLFRRFNADGDATTYEYDVHNNQTAMVDAEGVRTEQAFDALDRLWRSIEDAGANTDDINATVEYTYDARDNLLDVVDPNGLTTSYVYDPLGDLRTLISPDTGTTTYEYDKAGNRTAQTDARGVRTEYGFDQLNRLRTIGHVGAPQLLISFDYDTHLDPNACPAGSLAKGRLTRMTDSSGSTIWCHDHRGNIIRKIQTAGGISRTTGWSFDLADRMVSASYSSGLSVTYIRDALGRITSLSFSGASLAGSGGNTLLGSVTHLPFGPLSQLDFGDGRSLVRSFDLNYWNTSVVSSRNAGLKQWFEHDTTGAIIGLSAQPIGQGGGLGVDRRVELDDLSRITGVRSRNDSSLESYGYDATGNRQVKSSIDPLAALTGIYAYTPPAGQAPSHRLQHVWLSATEAPIEGSESRTFDAAGNLILREVYRDNPPHGCCDHQYTFDQRNRMTSAAISLGGPTRIVEYDYNGRGERVWRKAPPAASGGLGGTTPVQTSYVYGESGQLLGEYGSSAASSSEIIWLDSLPVGVRRNGVVHPIEADHLGTPRVIAQGNDALWRWDPQGPVFGEQLPNEDADGNGQKFIFNLRFPGQQYDSETKLHYNYFRDYEPATGRYVESDPIGLRGGISTYSYSNSAPIRYVDPHGKIPCSGEHGTTECQNGEIVAKVCNNDPCTEDCTAAHEAAHVKYAKENNYSCRNRADGSDPVPPSPFTSSGTLRIDEDECQAYEEGLEKCAGDFGDNCDSAEQCRDKRTRFRQHSENLMVRHCQLALPE